MPVLPLVSMEPATTQRGLTSAAHISGSRVTAGALRYPAYPPSAISKEHTSSAGPTTPLPAHADIPDNLKHLNYHGMPKFTAHMVADELNFSAAFPVLTGSLCTTGELRHVGIKSVIQSISTSV